MPQATHSETINLESTIDHKEGPVLFLQKLKTDDLKKLISKDNGIIGYGIFFSFCLFVCVIVLTLSFVNHPSDNHVNIIFGTVLYAILTLTVWFRISFLRIPIVILFAAMLIGIPLGTIMGIIGLRSFHNASLLFGKNRLRRKDIFIELHRRSSSSSDSANPIDFDLSNIKIKCSICKHYTTPSFGIDNIFDRGNCSVHNTKFKSEHSCEQFSYNHTT